MLKIDQRLGFGVMAQLIRIQPVIAHIIGDKVAFFDTVQYQRPHVLLAHFPALVEGVKIQTAHDKEVAVYAEQAVGTAGAELLSQVARPRTTTALICLGNVPHCRFP